jgi:hypothetical protein
MIRVSQGKGWITLQKLSNQTLLDLYDTISEGLKRFDEAFVASLCKEIAERGLLPRSAADALLQLKTASHS